MPGPTTGARPDDHGERAPYDPRPYGPVEVGDDRLEPPVAVAVDDVAPVALGQQVGVVLLAGGPLPRPRPDADLVGPVRHRVVRRALAVVGRHQKAATVRGARCGRARARTRAVPP